MYIYIFTGDFREKSHDQVQSVRASYDDACEDAKAYILRHNDEDFVHADKHLPARKFVNTYTSMWLTSGSILRRKVK